jgi:parallel beta-helix repeat protein
MKPLIYSTLLLAFIVLPSSFLRAQGSLTPPGAPAPTMKTLEQIEPRIDLQNAPAAAVTTTNANYHFIINRPGSYFLSANLDVTKTHGVQINSEGVTLDLNGFEISRASGSGGNGIEIPATSHRASVRHGSIKGFDIGVRSLSSPGYTRGCAFRDLAASGCTDTGILAGDGAVVEACRAHDNSGSYGILAGAGSTLTNCTASTNSGTYGIYAGTGSTLTNCSASSNSGSHGIYVSSGSTLTNCSAYFNTGSYGIDAASGSTLTNCSAYTNSGQYGIRASFGVTLTNCAAYANTSSATISAGIGTSSGCTITHCSSYNNTSSAGTFTSTTGMGFDLSNANTIQHCTAYSNKGDGINILADSLVRANTCASNGSNGNGAGIHATSSDNRIEGNNVTGNDRGIDVDAAGNFIAGNTASGNATNWDVAAGNKCLVVLGVDAAAIVGDSGGTSPGSTSPWANFTY